MTETVDEVAPAPEQEFGEPEEPSPDEPEPEEQEPEEAEESVSELVEQLGRDTSTLIFREVVLSATEHAPELRREARDVAVALGVVVASDTSPA